MAVHAISLLKNEFTEDDAIISWNLMSWLNWLLRLLWRDLPCSLLPFEAHFTQPSKTREVSLGSKHELLRKCPMLNISPTLLGGIPLKTILDQVWNLVCVAGNVWKITKILVHFQFHSVYRQNEILENWNISHRIRMCRLWNTCLFLVNLYLSIYLFPRRITFVTLERFVTQHLTPCLKSRRRKVQLWLVPRICFLAQSD